MSRYHRFIPVRKAELIRNLRADFGIAAEQAQRFDVFADLLKELFRHSFDAVLEEMTECYYPFNPDRDTVTLDEFDASERLSRRARLCELFSELMNVANCERMTKSQFEEYVAERSVFDIDVRVDAGEYDELLVFYRGELLRNFERRTIRRLFRKEQVCVDCFQRLFILLKTKEDPHVYIKMFKEIPANALETLLPKLDIRMRLSDKLRLGGSGMAGVLGASIRMGAGAFKYVRSLPLASGIAVIAAGFYGARTFLGFRKMWESYVADLAKRLYFNNLDNNLGVIRSLIDMAVEEELEEALLAWCILNEEPRPIPPGELKKRAEAYLLERYKVEVEFEHEDALRKLRDRGMLTEEEEGLSVLSLQESMKILDGRWDDLYTA